jgi:hypothetical protein
MTGGPVNGRESRFAACLDHLFRATAANGGPERSYRQVAAGIFEMTGTHVGVATLHSLRAGVVTDPRMSTVEAIATYFGVPVDYFFDEELAARVNTQLGLLQALANESIQSLALRADGLSPDSLNVLRAVVDQARAAEGLDQPGRKVFRRKSSDRSDPSG